MYGQDNKNGDFDAGPTLVLLLKEGPLGNQWTFSIHFVALSGVSICRLCPVLWREEPRNKLRLFIVSCRTNVDLTMYCGLTLPTPHLLI